MQKLSYFFLISTFLFILNIAANFEANARTTPEDEKNILVLHSYHQGLEWTDSITSGIQSVFGTRPDVNVIFEYLDTKRNFNENYAFALQSLHRIKAKQMPFNAIITSDNAAFDFLREHGDEFYPNVPIFYCGVNNLNPDILKDYPKFWGTGERADHFGTLSSIKSIFPERKNLLIINDNTLTGQAIKAEIEEILEKFESDFNYEIISDFTLTSLQEKVKTLDSSYAIYLLVINRDKNGSFISYRNGINHIKEASKVPIFGSWDFYQNKGLFGGSITSGAKQGKYAANLAVRFIDNTFSNDIPHFEIIASDYIFDYNEMTNFQISKDQLPIDSTILNAPKEQNLILRISIISVIILTFLVFILLIWLKIKQQRAVELKTLVSERTSELNEVNKELEVVIQNKNKFFSILAHDLRGSIGMILNLSTFVNQEVDISEEQKKEFNTDLLHVANRTNGLLEDLFYWGVNQFKGGPDLSMSEFNVNEVLSEITKTFKINKSEVVFSKNFEGDIMITNDMNICKFIFRNIIQNAIKFSYKGGIVSLNTKKENDFLFVEVNDQGIGMSQKIIDSIYTKNPIRKEGVAGQKSTGLGLPTVLEYLEILDAELKIESKEGEGSTFTIVLPNQVIQ